MNNYRKIWITHFGEIPKEKNGRAYEIHHIDGNHKNNNIKNLKLVTIQEHYDIHLANGDYGACTLIAKRMNMPPDFLSTIQNGCKRPGIGGAKKGCIPWNKGKKNVMPISENLKEIRSINSKGENNSRSVLTENIVHHLIKTYLSKPDLPSYNEKRKNGRYVSYETAFAEYFHKEYNVTKQAITRLLSKKSWLHVWEKFEKI